MYRAALHLYPRAFRGHYGPAMEQTFDDLLAGEPSPVKRMGIWVRALLDTPVSATREHIHSKGVYMTRTAKLLTLSASMAILVVGIGSYWFGNLHARENVGIERVNVMQLADAMQHDSFYSNYGDAALLFDDKISTVTHKDNATLVTFVTNRPYTVSCQFPGTLPLQNGQTVSVAAPGGSADRLKAGVLLHNCLQN